MLLVIYNWQGQRLPKMTKKNRFDFECSKKINMSIRHSFRDKTQMLGQTLTEEKLGNAAQIQLYS